MKVPAARPRSKSSLLGAEGRCQRQTRAVSPQRSKALLLASHLSISATRLPYQDIAVRGSRRRCRHRHVTIWERPEAYPEFKSCKSGDRAHPWPCSGSQITAIPSSPGSSFPNGPGLPPDDGFPFCSAQRTVLIGKTLSG